MNSIGNWKCSDRGEGRILVLLHGIGMSAETAWSPVLDKLAEKRRVIAFDIPGFGASEPLPGGADRSPKGLAEDLKRAFQKEGISEPVDVVGNSLGGFIALEFAKLGQTRSIVLLSPAGLWRGTAPRWAERNLNLIRWTVRHPCRRRVAKRLMRFRICRTILLRIPVAAKGWRIPADEAVKMLNTFADATDFDAVAKALLKEQFRGGEDISKSIPCTVAFGDKDWLLRKKDSQYPDELPKHHCWKRLPGCGHVPMWDDAEAVIELILDGTV